MLLSFKANSLRSILYVMLSFFISNTSLARENLPYPDDFKLLAYNVFMLPAAFASWSESQRAEFIANAEVIEGYDAIIFSELFHNSASNKLLSMIKDKYPYQTPVLGRSKNGWDETLGAYDAPTGGFEDGGVSIVSKWPIEAKVQYIYTEACGVADESANKGFVYVRLNKKGALYHVIGTHTQAEDVGAFACYEGEPARIRQSQFKELNNFVVSRNISASEIVFIGGDMNVILESDEYPQMLSTLNVSSPDEYAGARFSWDPMTNGIVNYKYPQYSGQQLDYIFISASHAQPSYWHNLTMDPTSPVWFNEYNFQEYSDHYPVAGFAYADDSTRVSSYRAINIPYNGLRLKSQSNQQYVKIDRSRADGWLTVKAGKDDPYALMIMDNHYPAGNAFCIKNNDYIRVQGTNRQGYFWNWWAQNLTGRWGYYTKYNDASNRLRIRILNDHGKCLKNGDQVAFIDGDTLNAGIPDYALKVWPGGGWKDYLFLETPVNQIGAFETFTVEMGTPAFENWSQQLRY